MKVLWQQKMVCQVFIKKGLFIYTFMKSTRKWVGDLEICQKFVNSITECLRDFEDSNVLNKIYLLFIFWNRRGAREKNWSLFANITNVWPQMKLTVIKVFYKILKRKIEAYRRWKLFPNEAFMVDIQNRFFQLIIL